MLIYLRQTPSIKLPFGSDCWDCRYVCRHPAGYSDWVRASLRFTNNFLNIANKNSPPKTKACSISCCMMYSCQSSVWFFATRGWLSDLSSLGNARKDASNGSIQNPSIHYAGNYQCRKVVVLKINSYFGEIIFFHEIVGNKPRLSPQPYAG